MILQLYLLLWLFFWIPNTYIYHFFFWQIDLMILEMYHLFASPSSCINRATIQLVSQASHFGVSLYSSLLSKFKRLLHPLDFLSLMSQETDTLYLLCYCVYPGFQWIVCILNYLNYEYGRYKVCQPVWKYKLTKCEKQVQVWKKECTEFVRNPGIQ